MPKSNHAKAKHHKTNESGLPEPDLDRALALAVELMRIPGKSCHEGAVSALIRNKLRTVGVPSECIISDDAHTRSPAGGETGNLIVKLPGTHRAPRRLLMAHLDTVPICVGTIPERRGDYIESANPESGLGADNRSGTAVILSALLEIFERKLPHPPLTFFWTIQEELGLFGSRFVKPALLGKPKLAWNWDGRGPHRITIAATGGHTIHIKVHGIASHAGGAPECGVSAIAVTALAINELVIKGWHGDIIRGRKHGTCNLGMIKGGDATNVVTDFVEIQGECRSYDATFRELILKRINQAFQQASKTLHNDQGERGRVEIESQVEYESFRLDPAEPSVQIAETVIRGLNMTPEILTSNGALDANWMNFHGIPTATLGCGQVYGHSVRECLDIEQFQQACRVALRLATACS